MNPLSVFYCIREIEYIENSKVGLQPSPKNKSPDLEGKSFSLFSTENIDTENLQIIKTT